MSKLTDGINFLHFFANLKESLSEIKKSLDGHSKELDTLEKQNLMLLSTIQHLNETVSRQNSRIDRLEANAMNCAPPKKPLQQQLSKPKRPNDGA